MGDNDCDDARRQSDPIRPSRGAEIRVIGLEFLGAMVLGAALALAVGIFFQQRALSTEKMEGAVLYDYSQRPIIAPSCCDCSNCGSPDGAQIFHTTTREVGP